MAFIILYTIQKWDGTNISPPSHPLAVRTTIRWLLLFTKPYGNVCFTFFTDVHCTDFVCVFYRTIWRMVLTLWFPVTVNRMVRMAFVASSSLSRTPYGLCCFIHLASHIVRTLLLHPPCSVHCTTFVVSLCLPSFILFYHISYDLCTWFFDCLASYCRTNLVFLVSCFLSGHTMALYLWELLYYL